MHCLALLHRQLDHIDHRHRARPRGGRDRRRHRESQQRQLGTVLGGQLHVLPTVTGISPNFGPTAGGTSVTITGTGFAAPATVSFGANAGSPP